MPSLYLFTPLLNLAVLPVAVLIFAVNLRKALRAKLPEGRLVAGWAVAAVAFTSYDGLLQNNLVSPESVYTSPYAIISLFFIFSYIMFQRYTGAFAEVARLNKGLAQRLQARETELEQSYQRLRVVENEQMLGAERRRLMQDMHDGLGSSLISAIRSVEQGAMTDSEISGVLKGCMDDLKLAIDSMESVDADLLLLLATLRFRLAPRIESAGLALRWEVQSVPALSWLNPGSALHILRIMQECVANVLRHTRATTIRFSTATDGQGVCVVIEDNGEGFAVEEALHRRGRGLRNQQRRATAIGGTVNWESGSAGTRFTLWLPLEQVRRHRIRSPVMHPPPAYSSSPTGYHAVSPSRQSSHDPAHRSQMLSAPGIGCHFGQRLASQYGIDAVQSFVSRSRRGCELGIARMRYELPHLFVLAPLPTEDAFLLSVEINPGGSRRIIRDGNEPATGPAARGRFSHCRSFAARLGLREQSLPFGVLPSAARNHRCVHRRNGNAACPTGWAAPPARSIRWSPIWAGPCCRC